MKKMKNLSKVLGIALLIVVVALAFLTYWHPGARTLKTDKVPQNDRRQTVRLVALGDSLTQGVGDQTKTGGYTSRIQKMVHQKDKVKVIMHNYGRAGDRSDQIEKRLGDSPKMQQQVKQAQVITLTVGGNDLLQTLTKNVMINQQSKLDRQLDQAEDTYRGKLESLLNTVRKYNGHASIFIYSIYNPIYVYFANVTQITNAVTDWNKVTTKATRRYQNLYYVDIDRPLSVGQYRSISQQAKLKRAAQESNSGELSVETFQKQILASDVNDELNDYLSPADHFHPNAKGYRLMTQKLYTQMQAHQQWLKK